MSSTPFERLHLSLLAFFVKVSFFVFGYPKEIRSVQAAWSFGSRARDWDLNLIEKGIQKRLGTSQEPYCRLMAYYHHHDSGDNEQAYAQVKRACEFYQEKGQTTPLSKLVNLELAYIMGILYVDLPFAKQITHVVYQGSKSSILYLRAKASVEIATGESDPIATLNFLEERLAAQPSRNQDNMQAERDWLQALRHKANRPLDA